MRQFSIKALAAGFAFAGMLSTGTAQEITGAGASFPRAVVFEVGGGLQQGDRRADQLPVGRLRGWSQQIRGKTVDFGASDMPLSRQLAKDGLVQFPTVIGGVVPVVNVPGIKPGEIKMTGQLLADIYLGKIKKWNDPAIANLNPGRQAA